MDTSQKLEKAIEWAKQNPTHPKAVELEMHIKAGEFSQELTQLGYNPSKFRAQEQKPVDSRSAIESFSTGVAKGELSTLKGLGTIGTKILRGGAGLLFGEKGKKFVDENTNKIYQKDTQQEQLASQNLQPTNTAEKVGKFTEQAAEFALPASKISKITEGSNFLTKVGTRAVTSGGVATAQSGGVDKNTGIAAGVEVALPVVGIVSKPVIGIVKRLFKGVGSGLSGVSTSTIDSIIQNPNKAIEISRQLAKEGQDKVIEDNAKTIVNGVSQIRKEASQAYSKGLDSLSKTDINPTTIKDEVVNALDRNKISIDENGFNLDNADFIDQKIKERAGKLIEQINNQKEFDGSSIRKLMDIIDSNKFKSAPDGDRQAFNAFANDLKQSLRDAIGKSTNKLNEINAKYSGDLQLSEAIENMFGSVNFKSLPEVLKASQKLESLFSQKGLAGKVTDDFLKRIGVNPAEFRTSEAVRQIGNKAAGANTTGTSFGELTREATSAIFTPKLIRNLSIATGLAEKEVKPQLLKLSPTFRAALIKFLTPNE